MILGARGFVPRALRISLETQGIPILALGSADLDLAAPSSASQLASHLNVHDALVMTAALTPEKGRDPATLITNLRMAENVAAALVKRPCAHLVYFSSDAIYGPGVSEIGEVTPTAPNDLYGVMHLSRELILAQAAGTVGMPFCALRPCAIYGSGDTHNSYGPNRFVRSALTEGKIRLFGEGEEIRDHVFIDDVVELTLRVLAHRSTGPLNLVSAKPLSFAAVAAEIGRLLDGKIQIENLARTGPVTHRTFDPTAIKAAFPDFSATALVVGLGATLSALRSPL